MFNCKIFQILIIGCTLFISSCDNLGSVKETQKPSHESVDGIMESVMGEPNTPRIEAYENALNVLYDLGIYGFDPSAFSNCEKDNLQSYYLRRQVPGKLAQEVDSKVSNMTGDEVFEYLLRVAVMSTDETNEEFDFFGHRDNEHDANLLDNLLVHLIWLSSEKGSPDGLNEIGAAQIYCYQDTEQDIEAAVLALKQAALKGDAIAKLTLGKVYYTGMEGFHDPERGKKLQDEAFAQTLNDLISARDNIEIASVEK